MRIACALEQEDGFPPVPAEWVGAEQVGESLYRLTESPAFAYGLARGDVVRTRLDGDVPWAQAVERACGAWCVRVVVPVESPITTDEAVARFEALGLDVRRTDVVLFVVEVPAEADPRPVLGELARGDNAGHWYYDLGIVPPKRT